MIFYINVYVFKKHKTSIEICGDEEKDVTLHLNFESVC